MNNDLEQFCEERLKDIIELADNPTMVSLARIALAAKQAKPVAYTDNLSLETLQLNGMSCMWKEGNGAIWREQIPLYTTPQPAHTEVNSPVIPDGWVIAPKHVTSAMAEAGKLLDKRLNVWKCQDIYQAMLRAASKPESE